MKRHSKRKDDPCHFDPVKIEHGFAIVPNIVGRFKMVYTDKRGRKRKKGKLVRVPDRDPAWKTAPFAMHVVYMKNPYRVKVPTKRNPKAWKTTSRLERELAMGDGCRYLLCNDGKHRNRFGAELTVKQFDKAFVKAAKKINKEIHRSSTDPFHAELKQEVGFLFARSKMNHCGRTHFSVQEWNEGPQDCKKCRAAKRGRS